ncbi:MAG: hypothetical protein J5697_00890 [Clostridia bacterium]|nr:hypothetical protein [Clostridia bacterium]
MRKNKLSKKRVLTVLVGIMFLFTGAFICMLSVTNVNTFATDSPFERSYELGTTLTIPERNISVDRESTTAQAYITFPDGETYTAKSVNLSLPGIYTVEYRAVSDGEVYRENYSFTVNYPAFNLTSRKDVAEYGVYSKYSPYTGTYTDGIKGLGVRLRSGSSITFNHTIDLNKMTKDDALFSFYIMPDEIGDKDNTTFEFKVFEANDPDNYFIIRLIQNTDATWACYMTASACNQTEYFGAYYGTEGDPGGTFSSSYPYGFVAHTSFYGSSYGDKSGLVTIRYDNETQTIYATNNVLTKGDYLISLSQGAYQNKWRGFPSGQVKICAYGRELIKSSCGILFTSVAQADLTKKYLPASASDAVIDFGEYDKNDYPSAVVGMPYRIFDARPGNVFTAEKLSVNVYTSYNTSAKRNVEIVDGCFIPKQSVIHTIEYKSVDGFGNVNIKTLPVTVFDTNTPITFDLDQSEIETTSGTSFDIPEITNAAGGNGNLTLKVMLTDENGENGRIVDGDIYRIIGKGNYKLVYKLSDYNGSYSEKEISVNVGDAEGPLFTERPLLPKKYIVGGKYAVPELFAEDCTGSEVVLLTAEVSLTTELGAEIVVTDGYFTVPPCDGITVLFIATDTKGQEETVEYVVPVIDTGLVGQLDITKYFTAQGGTVIAGNKYLTLRPDGDYAKYEFIRELDGKNFSAEFKVAEGYGNFDRLRVTLTDYKDENKSIAVNLDNRNGDLYLSVNDGDTIYADLVFEGNVKVFRVDISGTTFNLDETYVAITRYLSGEIFNGFEDFVYMTIEIFGANGDAGVQFYRVNEQVLTSYSSDVISPNIFFKYDFGGEQEINGEYFIKPIYAVDVLDPYSEVKFSAIAPDGTYVTSEDGVQLKNVDGNREYVIKISSYGTYRFNYAYMDSAGNNDGFSYILSCVDKIAPVLTVSKKTITCKTGDAVTVPSYRVTDNLDEDVTVVIQIVDPTGYISTLTGNSFVPSVKGKYIIRYMAFDKQFNVTLYEVECIVR